MFHEVAHGLGIKNTLDGKGTVSEALKDYASSFEEGKADVLGLYMIDALSQQGRARQGQADGQLRHLPRRHPALGALRRQRRARQGQHGPLQLLRRARRVRARSADRPLPRRLRQDARGDERAQRKAAHRAGRRRLRRGQAHDRHAWAWSSRNSPADLAKLKDAKIPVDIRFEQGLETLGLVAVRSACRRHRRRRSSSCRRATKKPGNARLFRAPCRTVSALRRPRRRPAPATACVASPPCASLMRRRTSLAESA